MRKPGPELQAALADEWNRMQNRGDRVRVQMGEKKIVLTTVTSEAQMEGRRAVVWVAAFDEPISLLNVVAL